MKILTPHSKVTSLFHSIVIIVAQGLLIVFATIFTPQLLGNPLGNLELRAAAPGAQPELGPSSSASSWLFGLSCLLVVVVFVASLWPRKNDSNLLQRQRKFARVDGLFLSLQGRILTEAEQAEVNSMDNAAGLRWAQQEILVSEKLHKITLLSLSAGGVSLASRPRLQKGNFILLKLSSLPDFPTNACVAIVRVVWAHSNAESGEPFDVCGAKLLVYDLQSTSEALSQYLNFLMDSEPAA